MNTVKTVLSHFLIALPIVVLIGCGGSSGSSVVTDLNLDNGQSDAGDESGVNDPIDQPTGGTNDNESSAYTTVPLSSLPPLSDRLYADVNYGTIVSGPIVGRNELDNSGLIHEITAEITTPTAGIEIEKLYVIDFYGNTLSNLDYTKPDPTLVAVITNTSNAMLCDIAINDQAMELNTGETIRTDLEIVGYVTIDPKEFNFVSDRYDRLCIPAQKSAYAFGDTNTVSRTEFRDFTDENGLRLSGDDVVKLTIGDIEVDVENRRELDTNGLFGSSYRVDDRSEEVFYVSVSNPSARNLLGEKGDATVVYIDPDSGAPLGSVALTLTGDASPYVVAPGDDIEMYRLDSDNLLGSTSQLIILPDWSDNDSR